MSILACKVYFSKNAEGQMSCGLKPTAFFYFFSFFKSQGVGKLYSTFYLRSIDLPFGSILQQSQELCFTYDYAYSRKAPRLAQSLYWLASGSFCGNHHQSLKINGAKTTSSSDSTSSLHIIETSLRLHCRNECFAYIHTQYYQAETTYQP